MDKVNLNVQEQNENDSMEMIKILNIHYCCVHIFATFIKRDVKKNKLKPFYSWQNFMAFF